MASSSTAISIDGSNYVGGKQENPRLLETKHEISLDLLKKSKKEDKDKAFKLRPISKHYPKSKTQVSTQAPSIRGIKWRMTNQHPFLGGYREASHELG